MKELIDYINESMVTEGLFNKTVEGSENDYSIIVTELSKGGNHGYELHFDRSYMKDKVFKETMKSINDPWGKPVLDELRKVMRSSRRGHYASSDNDPAIEAVIEDGKLLYKPYINVNDAFHNSENFIAKNREGLEHNGWTCQFMFFKSLSEEDLRKYLLMNE